MSLEGWKAVADWATVILIALTVVSGSAALILGDKINDKQAERMAVLERETAEAVQKAEEEHLARVRIEEKLSGWKLGAEAQARVIQRIAPYKNTPFDLGVNPSELLFMETIDGLLGAAGWTRQLPKPNNQIFNLLMNNKARINYVSGVYVEIAESRINDLGPAAHALVDALTAEGVPVKAQTAPGVETSAVHIVIGSR